MKTKLIIPTIFIFTLAMFLLSSCGTQQTQDEKQIAYKSGEMLAKNIIEYYFIAHEEIHYANSYQLELASLLSTDENDTIVEEPFVLVNNVEIKVKLFTEYISLLQELQKKESIRSQSIDFKMFSLLNLLDSSKLCSADSIEMITDYISANQYNQELAVSGITELMFNIWNTDVIEWNRKLSKAYNNYAQMIDNIPTDVFDEDKLEKYVYEPYEGKATLVKIYKLNMKQEAYEQKSVFIDRTTFLMKTFLDLNGVYFRLAQGNDMEYVSWANEQIYNSLKTFEQNKN
ncbi:MAG: hypothetical protein JXL97_15010 [Bacteroidales bacterium]|nr:hypothetical protein [Bacteroidales bacterium]